MQVVARGKIIRPSILVVLSVGASLVLVSRSPLPSPAQPSASQPNVLIIVTDDQRPETLPAMDATRRIFERNGTTYTNAFATSTMCCPSRASIMTGRYPHNHGIRRNEDSALQQRSTLQFYLQQAGYQTALAGKYLNAWDEIESSPPHFDRWAAIDDSRYGLVYNGYRANVNGMTRTPGTYSTAFIQEYATRFLSKFEADDDQPWFLYVAPFSAHAPFEPEPRYKGATVPPWTGNPAANESDRSDKPPWVQSRNREGGVRMAVRQSRTLLSADDLVEALFGELERFDEKADTLALFVSDSGYLWGEHGVSSKRFPYTGAMKIVLMMRWPGHIEPGASDDSIVGNIDLAPTVLEAIGISPDPAFPIDGRSLITGEHSEILVEYFGALLGDDIPKWATLRGPDYQYSEYYDDSGAEIFAEYYDLIADPFQLENLYGDADPGNDPPRAVYSADLDSARACSGVTCP